MSRSRRNRYVGRIQIPPAEVLPVPYTRDGLRQVLGDAAQGRSPYSHFAIGEWALKFSSEWDRRFDNHEWDLDTHPEIEHMAEVALEVYTQWSLTLFNTYTSEELRHLDWNTVELPTTWFRDWLIQLDHPPV